MANTARLPRAAEVLRDQVVNLKPRTKIEQTGDPDGFNVYRSISISKATAPWLAPILEIIDDPRIASLETDDGGRLVVTFAPTVIADRTDPFPLEKVATVLQGP
jgi:hypothetical protein